MFQLLCLSWMTLHVGCVVFCKTAGKDSDGADWASNARELATSIRSLPGPVMVVPGRWNDLWSCHGTQSLGYGAAQKAFVVCWWRLCQERRELTFLGHQCCSEVSTLNIQSLQACTHDSLS